MGQRQAEQEKAEQPGEARDLEPPASSGVGECLVRELGPFGRWQCAFETGVEEVAEHQPGEVHDAEQRETTGDMTEQDPAMPDEVNHPDDARDQQDPAPVQQRGTDRDLFRVPAVDADGVTPA
ncbi:hypothetical protein ACFQX6_33685 [Streptosporangium lutulentum]